MVTAYDFPQIYERVGMRLGHFGCIMLELEEIPVSLLLGVEYPVGEHTPYYYSQNEMLRYVKGPVAETGAHATLLYGLTPDDNAGVDQQDSVNELLAGLDLSQVRVNHVDAFPPQQGEPYACVVAHLDPKGDLLEANRRLRFLPHIDTFVEYRPHVTLAYVKGQYRDWAVDLLNRHLDGQYLDAVGINYGGELA